jgi:preprotein translocase subunit SecA
VEQHNFEIRKQLLEYDNVMNKQREIIYSQRRAVLEGVSLKEDILEMVEKSAQELAALYTTAGQEVETVNLSNAVKLKFGIEIDISGSGSTAKEGLRQKLWQAYGEKEKAIGADLLRHLERIVFLQIVDSKWKDHLYAMDYLREGIGLRAYGQRDPLVEYKREAFDMFAQLIASIEDEAVETIFKLQPLRPERIKGVFSSLPQEFSHPEAAQFEKPQEEPQVLGESGFGAPNLGAAPPVNKPVQLSHPKVGRNDPCPCGSGKKYKKCCGR